MYINQFFNFIILNLSDIRQNLQFQTLGNAENFYFLKYKNTLLNKSPWLDYSSLVLPSLMFDNSLLGLFVCI